MTLPNNLRCDDYPELDEAFLKSLYASLDASDVVCIYLSGSRADGLANSLSDFDIYIVSRQGRKASAPTYDLHENSRIQCEWLTLKDLEEHIALVKERSSRAETIDKKIHDIVWRCLKGIALYDKAALTELKKSIDQDALQRTYIDTLKMYSTNMLEDFFGFWLEEDVRSSFYQSKEILGGVLDLYLGLFQEMTDRPKFRMKKACRSLGYESAIMRDYFDIMNTPEVNSLEDEYFMRFFSFVSLIENAYARFYLDHEHDLH